MNDILERKFNDKKNSKNRLFMALKNRGIDLADESKGKQMVSDGEAVYGAITDLAKEAIEESTKSIREKSNAHSTCTGLTKESIDQMKEFDEIIKTQQNEARKVLENVRSLKSAMALELKTLSNMVREIESMNINKIVSALSLLRETVENESIRKLFKD